ncbi:MAG TPA: ATP-binding protein [Lacipirellulaceae bacterium]|nr:ATP-binding protein [Lacipirellulaceae bacterium]
MASVRTDLATPPLPQAPATLGSLSTLRRGALFWRLLASFAALSLTAVLLLTAIFSRAYEDLLTRDLDARLQSAVGVASQLLATQWPGRPDRELQGRIRRVGDATGVRVTVIDADGTVLADSTQADLAGVEAMEPHGGRPEVLEALRSGAGSSRRTSLTAGEGQRYLALRVDSPAPPGGPTLGVVRASFPTASIEAELAGLNRWMTAIGVLAAAGSVAFAAWITAQATRPLQNLAEASAALVAGQYDQRVPVPSTTDDEIGAVARALSEASRRLARGERELRDTSETQATVLEGMTESVIAVDRGEHVMFANPSAGRLLGFQPAMVQGLPLLEAVRSHELRDAVQRALRTRQVSNCELTWRAGVPRTFDVLATPLPGDPPPGVVLVLRDISELKRLERMRQQFIANVSHELKTPLSSIKAYTETLLGGAHSDPVHCQRFLGRIDEQATRLQELILDMLSLARIESGQATLDLADIPVARVVRRCLADYEPQAVARSLTLENHSDDPGLRVHADEEGLRQILSTLIDNAVKYTPAGGRVSVRCRPDGRMAAIEVTDTGAGIAAEHHPHLFERFYRVDKARSRELGGTGLGLSIVKHLCQAMGGSVAVRSEVNRGSTFSVRLPLAAS